MFKQILYLLAAGDGSYGLSVAAIRRWLAENSLLDRTGIVVSKPERKYTWSQLHFATMALSASNSTYGWSWCCTTIVTSKIYVIGNEEHSGHKQQLIAGKRIWTMAQTKQPQTTSDFAPHSKTQADEEKQWFYIGQYSGISSSSNHSRCLSRLLCTAEMTTWIHRWYQDLVLKYRLSLDPRWCIYFSDCETK